MADRTKLRVLQDQDLLALCLSGLASVADFRSSSRVAKDWHAATMHTTVRRTLARVTPVTVSVPRRIHLPAFCSTCSAALDPWLTWSDLQACCSRCGHMSLLPPTAPNLVLSGPRLGGIMCILQGEWTWKNSTVTLLPNGGVYALEVSLEGGVVKRYCAPMFGGSVAAITVSPFLNPIGRVRARLGPCKCGNPHDVVECHASGKCKWTPWSAPGQLFP